MTILLITFYIQLLVIFRFKVKSDSFLLSTIKAGLSISLTIFCITSFLNFLHKIDPFSNLLSWLIVNLIPFIFLLKNNANIKPLVGNTLDRYILKLRKLTFLKKMVILMIALFTSLLFTQGLLYPPTNWDSMTYHLPRIMQWIQHGSLAYYPTHIVRQLYQPPFAEYAILQTVLLNKSDLFAFAIQFMYYLLVTFTVIEITSYFSKKSNVRWVAGLLCLFLPEAVLQATSTQNDVVVSFFIASSILFLLLILKTPSILNFIFLGVSIGLALLTKALAYVYLPVFVGLFLVLFIIKNYKTWKKSYFIGGILTLVIVFSVNINHLQKNYALCHNIMGTDPKEDKEYKLEDRSIRGISSNIIKNIGLHLDPFFVGNLGNILVEKIHIILHYDVNKKGMNYVDTKFTTYPGWRNHEDTQPNFLHLLLGFTAIISIVFVFLRKNTEYYTVSYYYICILVSFLLFNYLLKWQPWNTRIHLPLFFLMIPAIALLITQFKIKSKIIFIATIILIPYGFYLAIFNYSRPLITKERLTSSIKYSDNRYKKYFANKLSDYDEYQNIRQKINPTAKNIGLQIHSDAWEYPLYYPVIENKNKFENILIKNYSAKYPIKINTFAYLISNLENGRTFKLNRHTYYNLTPKNTKIWLYKLQK